MPGSRTPYALINFSTVTNTGFQLSDTDPVIDKALVINGDKIESVCAASSVPQTYKIIDLQGDILCPGFIDLQLNGCGGVLFNSDISPNTLDKMHSTNLRFGCTSFLPTLITSSDDDMRAAIEVTKAYKEKHPGRVLGLHLEGPYLNKDRKGIHDEQFIRPPSGTMIDFICDHSDTIAMITLAPEVCTPGVIEQLSESGILVSLGHTNATLEQVREAEKSGARFVTHLFNAMSQLQNRKPGVVGATFTSEALRAGIIADGLHLDWNNLRLAYKVMGDRLVLVTDATPAAGSDIPSFEFGGQTVFHRDGKCTGADGTLGGSALTMLEAVRNCIEQGIPTAGTIQLATYNPASALGLEGTIGAIQPGYLANLVIVDQHFDKVVGTVSGGDLVFQAS